jgi:hypothetical protein
MSTSYVLNMRLGVALYLFLVLVFLPALQSQSSDLALVGAKIYLSPSDPPIESGTILSHSGRIRAVGPTVEIKGPHARPSSMTTEDEGIRIRSTQLSVRKSNTSRQPSYLHKSSAASTAQPKAVHRQFPNWKPTLVPVDQGIPRQLEFQ